MNAPERRPSANKSPFDDHSAHYSKEVSQAVAFAGQEHAFYLKFKARLLLDLLRTKLGRLADARVLDFGCGIGSVAAYLLPNIPHLEGTDVSQASLDAAAKRLPAMRFSHAANQALPYDTGRFDAAFAVCVFHHIIPGDRQAWIAELTRVLKPGGVIVIMEHNPYNPGTRIVVRGCELDRDAQLLTMKQTAELFATGKLSVTSSSYFLFFPWDNRLSRVAERAMRKLPLGAQYMVAAEKPR